MERRLGKVTVAPGVLVTIAKLTTLSVPGVAGLSSPRFPRRAGKGVKVHIEGDTVSIQIRVVAELGTNLLELGRTIQKEVHRAIHDMVGMEVREVNVLIDDVSTPASRQKAESEQAQR